MVATFLKMNLLFVLFGEHPKECKSFSLTSDQPVPRKIIHKPPFKKEKLWKAKISSAKSSPKTFRARACLFKAFECLFCFCFHRPTLFVRNRRHQCWCLVMIHSKKSQTYCEYEWDLSFVGISRRSEMCLIASFMCVSFLVLFIFIVPMFHMRDKTEKQNSSDVTKTHRKFTRNRQFYCKLIQIAKIKGMKQRHNYVLNANK